MRPVAGLRRPGAQWALVGGAALLVALLWWALLELRETRAAVRGLHAATELAAKERASLEAELARERSAREALALEVGRQRTRLGGTGAADGAPTLTLDPLARPPASRPEPSIAAPAPDRVLHLRLLLPAGAPRVERAQVVARDWSSGEARWIVSGRAAVIDGRRMVRAFVTGEMLAPGPYEIQVRGDRDETVALYVVEILRQVP